MGKADALRGIKDSQKNVLDEIEQDTTQKILGIKKDVVEERAIEIPTTSITKKTFRTSAYEKKGEIRITLRLDADLDEAVTILTGTEKSSKNTLICLAIQEFISKPEYRRKIEAIIKQKNY